MRAGVILAMILGGSLGLSTWASIVGAGIAQPEKAPLSIREDSQRSGHFQGRGRTHYFVGGGFHGGK